jgi:hypothetical protein
MAKTVSECVYDNEKHSQIASTFPSLRADGRLPEQRPRGPGPVEIPTATPSHSLDDGVFADAPSPTKLDRIPSTSSDVSRVVTNEPAPQQMFEADQVPHGELVLVRGDPPEQCVSLDTSPSVLSVPSFFLPTIPPELRIPLSFLGKERLQVQMSDTTATDLDMKSCVLE